MGDIKVNYATIANAQQSCQQGSKAIDSSYDQLVAQLNPLTASWSGQAMQQWQTCQAQWDQALQEFNQVLNQIQVALGQIGEGYQQTDQSVGSMFG